MRPRLMAPALLLATGLYAQDFDKVLEARVDELVKLNGKGTDQKLKQRLIRMGKQDQAVRKPEYVSDAAAPKLVREQERTDARLTVELKQIVAKKGWPTIALVGLPASENASLILTHSQDHDFQRELIPKLQQLAENGKIFGSSIAGIVDKVLVSEGKPQRFGTQFKWANGSGEMLPVEDPEHLEQRRAQYLLPPMAEQENACRRVQRQNRLIGLLLPTLPNKWLARPINWASGYSAQKVGSIPNS
jgi:hypothetical protein